MSSENKNEKPTPDLDTLKAYPIDLPFEDAPRTAIHNPQLAEDMAHAAWKMNKLAETAKALDMPYEAAELEKKVEPAMKRAELIYYAQQGTSRNEVKKAQRSNDWSRIDPELIQQADIARKLMIEEVGQAQYLHEREVALGHENIETLRTVVQMTSELNPNIKLYAMNQFTREAKMTIPAKKWNEIVQSFQIQSFSALGPAAEELSDFNYDDYRQFTHVPLRTLQRASQLYRFIDPDQNVQGVIEAYADEVIELNTYITSLLERGINKTLLQSIASRNMLDTYSAKNTIDLIERYIAQADFQDKHRYGIMREFEDFIDKQPKILDPEVVNQLKEYDAVYRQEIAKKEEERQEKQREYDSGAEERQKQKREERYNKTIAYVQKGLEKLRDDHPDLAATIDNFEYNEPMKVDNLPVFLTLLAGKLSTDNPNREMLPPTNTPSFKQLVFENRFKMPKGFYGGRDEFYAIIHQITEPTRVSSKLLDPTQQFGVLIDIQQRKYKGTSIQPKLEYISTLKTMLFQATTGADAAMRLAIGTSDLDADLKRIEAEQRISIDNARGIQAIRMSNAFQGGRMDGNTPPRH